MTPDTDTDAGADVVIKVGLALVRDGYVLLVRRRGDPWLILPGGKPHAFETDEQTLVRESWEELSCRIDTGSLRWLGEFSDERAGREHDRVTVRLYSASLEGTPRPSAEIEEIVWHSLDDTSEESLAPSLSRQIIPRLAQAD